MELSACNFRCIGIYELVLLRVLFFFRPHCEMHLISVLVDRASFGINDQAIWLRSIKFDIASLVILSVFFLFVLFAEWTHQT